MYATSIMHFNVWNHYFAMEPIVSSDIPKCSLEMPWGIPEISFGIASYYKSHLLGIAGFCKNEFS